MNQYIFLCGDFHEVHEIKKKQYHYKHQVTYRDNAFGHIHTQITVDLHEAIIVEDENGINMREKFPEHYV